MILVHISVHPDNNVLCELFETQQFSVQRYVSQLLRLKLVIKLLILVASSPPWTSGGAINISDFDLKHLWRVRCVNDDIHIWHRCIKSCWIPHSSPNCNIDQAILICSLLRASPSSVSAAHIIPNGSVDSHMFGYINFIILTLRFEMYVCVCACISMLVADCCTLKKYQLFNYFCRLLLLLAIVFFYVISIV